MKEIRDNSIFKIRCTVDSAPRDIYLIKNLELIKKLFRNAYIIPKVNWSLIGNFYEFMTGKDLDGMLPSRWSPIHSRIDKLIELKKEIKTDNLAYQDKVLEMYTVVPFTPSLEDYRSHIKTWKLDPKVLVLSNDRNIKKSFNINQATEFYSILLAASHNMGLIVEGVIYDSPCRLCKFVLNKLAGECEIYNTSNQGTKMCSPRLNFNAQLFTNRDVSVLQDVDYAEVLSLWSEEQKIDV